MSSLLRTLSEFPLFASLDEHVLTQVVHSIHERTYEPGQVVVFGGEACEAVYLVVQGVLRARRLSMEGREYVLAYIGPGEVFNMVPAFDNGKNVATVEALTNATVYLFPCDRFRQLVYEHRDMAMIALERLAGRVRYLSDRVEDLALHTVRTRLARFLLANAADGARARRWTQEEIAAQIGTVRDVVGRTLRGFAREGLIRRSRGRLVISDREALEREAMHE
jgi:CRP/FNR family cyclic AMP-dependent transcriptional regulator